MNRFRLLKNKDQLKFKGVIFDFNGTLFWDTKLHNKAWDLFLEKMGIHLTDQEKNTKIHGKNNQDIFNIVFPGKLPGEEIQKFISEKERIYQSLCLLQDMQLAPGAKEFLNFLITNKIPNTIATASGLENVDFYFEHLGLDSIFDRSKVIFNDGSLLSKPHPQIFQKAMSVLDIKKNETLVFEDSIAGIAAAENAGVGRIIIVDSNNDDYSRWNYQKIKSFLEVDKDMFESFPDI